MQTMPAPPPTTPSPESWAIWRLLETQRMTGDSVKLVTHPKEKPSLMEHLLPQPPGAFKEPPILFQRSGKHIPGPVEKWAWSGWWDLLGWPSSAIENRKLTYGGEFPWPVEEIAGEQCKHGGQFHLEFLAWELGGPKFGMYCDARLTSNVQLRVWGL